MYLSWKFKLIFSQSILLHQFTNAHIICFQFLAIYFVHKSASHLTCCSLTFSMSKWMVSRCMNRGTGVMTLSNLAPTQVSKAHRKKTHCQLQLNWLRAMFVLRGSLKWRFITTDMIDSKVCVAWQAKMMLNHGMKCITCLPSIFL